MPIRIVSNIPQAILKLNAATAAMPAAIDAGAKAVGTATLLETTQAMESGIYDAPLPESYARYGRDGRTGALLAGEAMVKLRDSAYVIKTENSGLAGKDPTLYAQQRHDLRKYPAPWRYQGFEEVAPDAPRLFTDVFSRAVPGALIAR